MTLQDIFTADIAKVVGIDTASSQDRQEFLDFLEESIFAQAFDRMENSLTPEQRKELGNFLDSNPPVEERDAFFDKNIPDFEGMLLAETLRVKTHIMKILEEEDGLEALSSSSSSGK